MSHAVKPILLPGVREPRRAFYFYRLRDDDFVAEFCIADYDDTPTDEFPDGQQVVTVAPDGTEQRWEKRQEGELLVFRPPDGYAGGQALGLRCDRRVQTIEPITRERLEQLALSDRVSVFF